MTKKSCIINLRVSEKQKERFETLSKIRNMSVSKFIIYKCLICDDDLIDFLNDKLISFIDSSSADDVKSAKKFIEFVARSGYREF